MTETTKAQRNILITGCTRGLGGALLQFFHDSGHSVAGCGRSEQQIHDLQETFAPSNRNAPLFRALDVTDAAAIQKWADDLADTDWVPDLLINNAATINRNAPLWEITAEEFGQVMDVNLKGVHHSVRAFVPKMIENGRGVVVNFSSGKGRSTSPNSGPYCTSKFGIEAFSSVLAQELPEGMACIALNPGIIETDMLRSSFGSAASSYQSPDQWVTKAGPFLLGLSEADNGGSLSIP